MHRRGEGHVAPTPLVVASEPTEREGELHRCCRVGGSRTRAATTINAEEEGRATPCRTVVPFSPSLLQWLHATLLVRRSIGSAMSSLHGLPHRRKAPSINSLAESGAGKSRGRAPQLVALQLRVEGAPPCAAW
jgi:hypothetical protein